VPGAIREFDWTKWVPLLGVVVLAATWTSKPPGLVLAFVALVLIRQTKALLLGESASAEVLTRIHEVINTDDEVMSTTRLLTMHLGPHDILLTTSVQLVNHLSEPEVARAITRLENRIRDAVPDVKHVCIDARRSREPG
jgi:divalent metal cation (Fe/Co/Zn/Cd) transporter